MGGEDSGNWDIYPENDAILIGTQDMLLSRALNRGYGMSRYRWPIHFALLNNDCLWVMDETQLMGPGLSTACQLEAFRGLGPSGLHSFGGGASATWYMSATSNAAHLRTREWRGATRPEGFEFGLTSQEKSESSGAINRRRRALKGLEINEDLNSESPELVQSILKCHAEMIAALASGNELPARTVIVCNTVDRAVALHSRLLADKRTPNGCELLLLHSRFRPPERQRKMEALKSNVPSAHPYGQIVVATQVIEAGVDISCGALWSEVAPLASLVQRFGRLNRGGEFNDAAWKPLATVFGVGVTAPRKESVDASTKRRKANEQACLPYEFAACEKSWKVLKELSADASPANLECFRTDIAASISPCIYSLQRHELLDFFDTDANLSLGFTDVSPFVRGLDEDTDLQVLWRENWIQKDGKEGTGEPGFSPDYQRAEMCAVPIGKAVKAREILRRGWLWRGKETGWLSMRDLPLAPGMTVLLPLDAGGYDNTTGWTGEKFDKPQNSYHQILEGAADEDQLSNLANGWQSIAIHTGSVASELRKLSALLLSTPDDKYAQEALFNAVLWHDIGKNHPDWQAAVLRALKDAGISGKESHQPFAKFSLSESPDIAVLQGNLRTKRIRELRNSFRPDMAHEVASALAFRAHEQARLNSRRDTDVVSLLAEYVIMSHHGHVRKVLRDELPKLPSQEKDTRTVRGVSDGDPLPPVEMDGQSLGCSALSTDCRRMGRGPNGHESYTRGVLRLLETYGPFRLAYFEALFRAADIRASIEASQFPRD